MCVCILESFRWKLRKTFYWGPEKYEGKPKIPKHKIFMSDNSFLGLLSVMGLTKYLRLNFNTVSVASCVNEKHICLDGRGT